MRRGRRRPHRRGRRHRRRHRVAAVPRGDPPAAHRGRPAERVSRARHAGAVHRRRRRAEDQADAALGAEAARDRHPARRSCSAAASARSTPALKKKIALFSNVAADAVFTAAGRAVHLRGAAPPPRGGARREDRRAAQHLVARARARPAGSASSSGSRSPRAQVDIGVVGKYVDLVESLQVAQRGAHPRRHRQRLPRHLRHIDSEEIEQRGAEALLRRRRRHPGRARLRRARHRGQDRGHPLRAREAASRSSASASACRWRSSSSRATCAASTGANSTEFEPDTPYPVIDLMPEQRERHRQGRHHAPRRLSLRARRRAPSAAEAYGAPEITERHRHRYEVNNDYREPLDAARAGALGRLARPAAGRDDRAARPPVLRRLPVPPRVQVAADGAAPAVPVASSAPRSSTQRARADGRADGDASHQPRRPPAVRN